MPRLSADLLLRFRPQVLSEVVFRSLAPVSQAAPQLLMPAGTDKPHSNRFHARAKRIRLFFFSRPSMTRVPFGTLTLSIVSPFPVRARTAVSGSASGSFSASVQTAQSEEVRICIPVHSLPAGKHLLHTALHTRSSIGPPT